MRAIVTGATGGLGYETALGLAQAGYEVILAGRNPAKGDAALSRLMRRVPAATVRFESLDLASLESVAAFAGRMDGPIAVLVNNAGVMAPDARQVTADGFELQMGTNYFGHFALTAALLPALQAGQAHVVQVSSLAHRRGALHFDDLQGERSYSPWRQYGQSKLAMLMFALELDRRSAAGGWGLRSNAAHPGWAVTDIIVNGPGGGTAGLRERVMQGAFSVFGQSAAAGARPMVYAATSPDAMGGGYYGPSGLGEIRGAVSSSRVFPQARDTRAAARLWEVSVSLTGASWTPTPDG